MRSSINGLPIPGVMVTVRGARVFGVSDSTGSFALVGLPDGRRSVRVLYGDSLSFEHEIDLKRGKTVTLSVLLDVEAVALAPLVVEARSLHGERSLAGFYERRKLGLGRFYTLEDLERLHDLSPPALLSQSGLVVRCRFRSCVPWGFNGANRCLVALFLDGMRISPDYLEALHLDELAGIEVYARALDVPRESQWWLGGDCGAVLMWGRY